jgi:hypothetical protein
MLRSQRSDEKLDKKAGTIAGPGFFLLAGCPDKTQ